VRRCGGEAGPNGATRHVFRVVRAGETLVNNCMGVKCYQRGFWVGRVVKWRTRLASAAARVVRTVEMSRGDGSARGLGRGRGTACYYFGKRGLRASQSAITEVLGGAFGEMAKTLGFCSSKGGARWWKWRGDGSMHDVGRGGGCCLMSFWKEGTPSYLKCYHRGFGWGIW
jgi:hypothetical protein